MKERAVAQTFVTPHPWALMNKRRYGNVGTYLLAAEWLTPCRTVADWGGGGGMFRDYLPRGIEYTNVDGTRQDGVDVVCELAKYRGMSEGILLRHVLDNTPEPYEVLANAMARYTKRLVAVTYTPSERPGRVVEYQYGWPVWHLDHGDLAYIMGPELQMIIEGPKGSGERVFCLERTS